MNIFVFLRRLPLSALLLCALAPTLGAEPARSRKARVLPAAGVNLSGAEFGKADGKLETDFHFPGDEDFAWAKSRGFAVVRLPFQWERLQPKLESDLDAAHLELLTATVGRARTHGLSIVLDLHNYGEWRGAKIGSEAVPDKAFADVWRRLAQRFSGQADVIFGLMNEPHDVSFAQWAKAAQAAIDAVRATGACNLLLVPGANWTGAHSWNAADATGSNAAAMAAIKDEGPHLFEFHQYLDADWSGTKPVCRKPEEVVAALSVATGWLRAQKKRGFLGEFGAADNPQCRAGLDAMLGHMAANSDVWAAWTYWAAGAWWPKDYFTSIQPLDGKDRPQMKTLAKWIGRTPAPRGCAAGGALKPR